MKTERLTENDIKSCYNYHSQSRGCGKTLLLRTCNELLEYKEIEKELGIDLIILSKAIKKGAYFLINGKIKFRCLFFDDIDCFEDFEDNNYFFDFTDIIVGQYYFKDYGKTWALTRKELEKQK